MGIKAAPEERVDLLCWEGSIVSSNKVSSSILVLSL